MEEDIQTIHQLSCFVGHPVYSHEYAGTVLRAPYNHFMNKLNFCIISLSES